MDNGRSLIEPAIGKSANTDSLERVAHDPERPLNWLYPWLLALAAIAITLLLTN